MAWDILLYGCFHSRGREYDFDILSSQDLAAGRLIRAAGLSSPSWFAGTADGRVFFGRKDNVANALSADHPIARDSRRPLEFVFGYTARQGTKLPSWSEFAALDGQFVTDLRKAAELAMASSKPVTRAVGASLPRFTGPLVVARDGSHWDVALARLPTEGDTIIVADASGQSQTRSDPGHIERGDVGDQAQADLELERLLREKGGAKRRRGCSFLFAVLGAFAIGGGVIHQSAESSSGTAKTLYH